MFSGATLFLIWFAASCWAGAAHFEPIAICRISEVGSCFPCSYRCWVHSGAAYSPNSIKSAVRAKDESAVLCERNSREILIPISPEVTPAKNLSFDTSRVNHHVISCVGSGPLYEIRVQFNLENTLISWYTKGDPGSIIAGYARSHVTGPNGRRSSINFAICSGARLRGALNRSRANWASAARLLASPASFTASARLAFERFRNSVWIRLFHMLNMTSPTIPMATPASGAAESVKNRPYGGWMMAMTNSAMMHTMTKKPHQILQRSQDSDAPSSSFSLAFFVPLGRYHAGKNGFRTCCVAFMVWLLIFALLLGAIYFWE
jgi:hypothetical protein